MFIRFVSKEGGLVISESLRKAWQNKKLTFFANFIQSPLVLLSLLAMAWGFHYLIRLMNPFFLPAPIVSCLVVLLVLSFLSWLSPVEYDEEGNRSSRRKYADPVLKVIEKPCDLILKHMAVCFTPSFILIPSGDKMPNKQIGLLTTWFLTSFIAVFAIVIVLHRLLGFLPFFTDKSKAVDAESTPTPPSTHNVPFATTPSPLSKTSPLPTITNPPPLSFSRLNIDAAAELEHQDRRRKSSVTTVVNSVMDLKAYGEEKEREREKGNGSEVQEDDREAASSQGESKQGDRSWVDEVDLGLRRAQSSNSSSDSRTQDGDDDDGEEEEDPDAPRPALFRKSYDWDARTIRDDGRNSVFGEPYIPPRTNLSRPATPFPPSETAADLKDVATRDLLVARLAASLDISLYFLFVVISLPIFYATRCSVPFFLTLNILMYLLVIKNIPKSVARFAHPILTTSFLTFFLIWGFGASVGWGLQETLSRYSNGVGYIQMWSINSPPEGRAPGAGDLLVDGLDAGIIALALPLYRYRSDLRKYFFRMMSLIVPAAVISLFVWPLGAIAVGLEPKTALAFVGRFSSTPLAVAQVARLMGDESITVVLVVLTGILVVIFQKPILWCCRVKDDDFLAIGLLFGVTAGAIGATGLHNSEQPRAAAIASLTFALFGTVLLIAVGIPPIAMCIQQLIDV